MFKDDDGRVNAQQATRLSEELVNLVPTTINDGRKAPDHR